MAERFSADRVRSLLSKLRDRLWIKPLLFVLLSAAAAFGAKLADRSRFAELVPEISTDSMETMLSIMAASMLVIATFSVGSMVAAYASASNTATPRSFALVVADGGSQNALSTFVGAFIFSIVALAAATNGYFGVGARFILFVLTIIIFGIVVITFVRWVDRIARLGRMGSTIDKVEQATAAALRRRRDAPTLGAMPSRSRSPPIGQAVFPAKVGYVQFVDIAALQTWAEEADARVVVAALPGAFAVPGRPLAFVHGSKGRVVPDGVRLIKSFQIGGERRFDDDPRFGLVVLSEIAGRALSPAVNDPGTAIDIIGTLVRLFAQWNEPVAPGKDRTVTYDRVEVPEISVRDMFDDAFTAIARDGAGVVEVCVRLQKALHALALIGDDAMQNAARSHGRLALKRAGQALKVSEDLSAVRQAARFAKSFESAQP